MRDERDQSAPYGTELYGESVSEQEIDGMPIINYPRIVEKPFVITREPFLRKLGRWSTLGFFFKKKNEVTMNPDLKQPLLFFMRDDGFTDMIEGVKPGLFRFSPKGSNIEKGTLLSPKKLTTLNIEPYYKAWFAYENEMTPYPLDVYHDAGELVAIVRTIETNRNLLKDEAKLISAKMWFWIAIIASIAGLLYFGNGAGWFDTLLNKG